MAYIARVIKDRIAVGDDYYYIVETENGKRQLIPAPDEVLESGTPVNKELLQIIEDRVVWLMNRVFDDINANPFNITFESLDGLDVTGVWNTSLVRIEC